MQYPGGADVIKEAPPMATPVACMEAPHWLTVEEVCRPSSWDSLTVLEIMHDGGVDVDTRGRIEKQSPYDVQPYLDLVLHWND
jgi:hypothetical protein